MQAYDDTKCEHQQLAVRCALCMAKAGKKPTAVVAPPSITGGPPPDIEECTPSLRDKVDGPAPADLIPEWEKPSAFDEPTASAAPVDASVEYHVNSVPATLPEHSGSVLRVVPNSFETLPTDDSHASKVVRAAAAYAEAAKVWAGDLAAVEHNKANLLRAQAKLDAATIEKDKAEQDLKILVNGAA